jgi:hypothetical protein
MVSCRILISVALLICAMSEIGCCSCHRRNIFRVQNSPCCTPAPKSACCEPVTSYRRANGVVQPIPEPPMAMAPAYMQQAR